MSQKNVFNSTRIIIKFNLNNTLRQNIKFFFNFSTTIFIFVNYVCCINIFCDYSQNTNFHYKMLILNYV